MLRHCQFSDEGTNDATNSARDKQSAERPVVVLLHPHTDRLHHVLEPRSTDFWLGSV